MVEAEIRPGVDEYKIIKHLGKGANAVVKLVEKDNKLYAMRILTLLYDQDTT